jgi:hypothetical protein
MLCLLFKRVWKQCFLFTRCLWSAISEINYSLLNLLSLWCCNFCWLNILRFSHIYTVHLDIIKVLFTNLMFVDPCIIVQLTKKNPTRCNNVSTFYYSVFIWNSTYFGLHTAHHQEPKTALAASGFSHVEGCWTCSWWKLSDTDTVPNNVYQLHVQQPSTYVNPETASSVIGFWWLAVCRLKHVKLHINME